MQPKLGRAEVAGDNPSPVHFRILRGSPSNSLDLLCLSFYQIGIRARDMPQCIVHASLCIPNGIDPNGNNNGLGRLFKGSETYFAKLAFILSTSDHPSTTGNDLCPKNQVTSSSKTPR